MEDYLPPMLCKWVIGRWSGKQAKSVEDHAAAGLTYFIIDASGRGEGREVVAAFRRACDSPVPEHLEVITDPFRIVEYEEKRKARMGMHGKDAVVSASDEAVERARKVFENRNHA